MLSEGNRYERIETTFSKRVLSSTLLSYDKKRLFFLNFMFTPDCKLWPDKEVQWRN